MSETSQGLYHHLPIRRIEHTLIAKQFSRPNWFRSRVAPEQKHQVTGSPCLTTSFLPGHHKSQVRDNSLPHRHMDNSRTSARRNGELSAASGIRYKEKRQKENWDWDAHINTLNPPHLILKKCQLRRSHPVDTIYRAAKIVQILIRDFNLIQPNPSLTAFNQWKRHTIEKLLSCIVTMYQLPLALLEHLLLGSALVLYHTLLRFQMCRKPH